MELETERLILREYAKNDKYYLFKLFSEKFAYTYEAHLPKNISGIEDYIEWHINDAISLNRQQYYYVIELRETHEFIGSIGYARVDEINVGGVNGSVVEVEYYLLEVHWNNGYMTEALQKIISSAFEKDDILKLFAQCHKDNPKSEKVMIKCGMHKSEYQPHPKFYNGVLKENVRYEFNRSSYINNVTNLRI